MTFYQPPAYVHILNKKTWLDRAVTWQPVDAASAKLCSPDSPKPATTPLSVSIQAASDGSVVVIRIVNSGSTKGTTVADISNVSSTVEARREPPSTLLISLLQPQQTTPSAPRKHSVLPGCTNVSIFTLTGSPIGLKGVNTPGQPTLISPTETAALCTQSRFSIAPLSYTVVRIVGER
jgi:hypothetical protein